MKQRIIIQEIDRPRSKKTIDEIKWICGSLGLTSGRDVEQTSFKILYGILHEIKSIEAIPTEQLASSLRLDAPCVNHHIRNFMESGVVRREKRKVVLRGGSLTAALEEMRSDSERIFEKLLEASKRIDALFFE